MQLSDILKDSNYKLTQFSQEKIDFIESNFFTKEMRGKVVPYFNCYIRKRDIRLTPEEVIRQLYIIVLTEDMGYSLDRMEVEYAVSFGRDVFGKCKMYETAALFVN
ncbi:type I restriction enzyme HsdR N-terminal domain-containing protein, partial [Oceanobacillus indicireducens]|uniref:type I restriction enzyme HsdR N-terminal domain-containing protein n=1 Tax=Oceanobacillus indicireducens TaxID=1004261 RepID=UPI001E4D488C